MSKRYAREFRRAVCERLVAGERISSVPCREIQLVRALSADPA
jgi:hypothetical protein